MADSFLVLVPHKTLHVKDEHHASFDCPGYAYSRASSGSVPEPYHHGQLVSIPALVQQSINQQAGQSFL